MPQHRFSKPWVRRVPATGAAAIFLTALALLPATPGCTERDRSPEVFSIDGKIDDIKITGSGGEITATYFSEKHNQNVVATAVVTKDTEIMINGALAGLSQIRKGEAARADVLVDRSGEERTYKVLKIYIDRPTEPAPTGAEPGRPQDGG
jgi:hypothetical protein